MIASTTPGDTTTRSGVGTEPEPVAPTPGVERPDPRPERVGRPGDAPREPSAETLATVGRRFGYVIAIAVNVFALWAVDQLTSWHLTRFVSDVFDDDVKPYVVASIVASLTVNAAYLVRDRGVVRHLGQVITNGFTIVATWVSLRVFPYDFADYGTDWAPLVRVVLWVALSGTAVALVVEAVRTVRAVVVPPS